MWETWICSLGWEYPLKKGMATHSSILAWRIPWAWHPPSSPTHHASPRALGKRGSYRMTDVSKCCDFGLSV